VCCVLLFLKAAEGFHVSSMPPRSKSSFGPPNDSATYRDLLLFEERLKTNAANLQRRKSRYQRESSRQIVVRLSHKINSSIPTSTFACHSLSIMRGHLATSNIYPSDPIQAVLATGIARNLHRRCPSHSPPIYR